MTIPRCMEGNHSRGLNKITARSVAALGFVLVVPFAFFSTLISEISQACWYAWNAAMQEVEAGKKIWRGKKT